MTLPVSPLRRGKLHIAIYLVGLMMVVLPLGELAVAAWPIRLHAIQWRFGLVGLFGNGFMGPMTGLLLIAVTAALVEQKAALRTVATVALIISLFAIAGWGSFVLDALQMRKAVKPEAHRAFDFAAGKALLGVTCALLASAWVGVGGWRASLVKTAAAKKKATATPMLITTSAPAPAAVADAPVVAPASAPGMPTVQREPEVLEKAGA
jgi:hypothetical protein